MDRLQARGDYWKKKNCETDHDDNCKDTDWLEGGVKCPSCEWVFRSFCIASILVSCLHLCSLINEPFRRLESRYWQRSTKCVVRLHQAHYCIPLEIMMIILYTICIGPTVNVPVTMMGWSKPLTFACKRKCYASNAIMKWKYCRRKNAAEALCDSETSEDLITNCDRKQINTYLAVDKVVYKILCVHTDISSYYILRIF